MMKVHVTDEFLYEKTDEAKSDMRDFYERALMGDANALLALMDIAYESGYQTAFCCNGNPI